MKEMKIVKFFKIDYPISIQMDSVFYVLGSWKTKV